MSEYNGTCEQCTTPKSCNALRECDKVTPWSPNELAKRARPDYAAHQAKLFNPIRIGGKRKQK